MTGMMKAVVKAAPEPGAIELRMVPIPQIGPRDVLVKVKAAAVCGTDIHIRQWNPWAQARVQTPVVLGHELAGEVVEVGSEVVSVKVGDRVSCETHLACHTCEVCREGNGHVCPNTKLVAVHQGLDGCFAEYMAVPEELVFACTNPNVPWEQLALMEPFGAAVHAVMDVPLSTKSVAIIGAGPLGQMGMLAAKTAGAAKVIVLEPNPERAAQVMKMGADMVIDPVSEDPVAAVKAATNGYGVHVAIDFSGNMAGLTAAMKYLRPEGQLTCVALPKQPIPVDVQSFGYRGCSVRGIAGRRLFDNWEQMRGLLDRGIDLSPIVTHRLPLEEFEKAMDMTERGECIKCVLVP